MAQTRTCDTCHEVNNERHFAAGWGTFHGTDSLGQYIQKDLCPRCSAILQVMLGELRRRFTTTGTSVPTVSAESSVERSGALPALPSGVRGSGGGR
jgi:hypothetical protein